MNKKEMHIEQASILLREHHSGVLASNSLSVKGYPFGSVTPFLMTEQGDIVIYASDIAQHSRNMKADSKVSLCVYNTQHHDSQANARVTILGTAKADEVSESIQSQYFALFPQARQYVQAHDFRFYLIQTQRVRYIGGFGEIYWFSQQEWQQNKLGLIDQAQGAIAHMHEDHSDALAEIISQQLKQNIPAGDVTMLTCYQHGFHFTTKDAHKGFVPFTRAISKDHSLRQAMVSLTKKARTPEPA